MNTQSPWKLFWHHVRPHWLPILGLMLLFFTNIAIQLINPLLLRQFIDLAIEQVALERLINLGIWFTGLAIGQQIIKLGEVYISENLGWHITNQLRKDLALHCLKLDMSFHNGRSPGELIERIDGDTTELSNFFSKFIILVLGNGLFIIGAIITLIVIDWRIGLVMGIFAIVVMVVLRQTQGIAVNQWKTAREASASLYALIEERVNGIEDIKTNAALPYVLNRLYQLMGNLLTKFRTARLRSNLIFISTSSLLSLGEVVALAVGVVLFFQDAITLGTVYLVYRYTQLLYLPVNQLTRQFEDLQRAQASIGRILELQSITSQIQDGPGVSYPAKPMSIEFNNVTFQYDKEPVLNGISFKLEPGQVLGLLGPTGSGKTTITRLLLRLYDSYDGKIQLGDDDIRQAKLTELRQSVGLVTQNVQLFRATIRDNLTFFDPSIKDEQIMETFSHLGLMSWYERLPDGLDTVLDPQGSELSAGEAQLLAFARIFQRKPRLVILDEASSRLDPVTERYIQQSVDTLLGDTSGILIAHHLETVMRSDLILILENGTVKEFGKREMLMNDPNSYFSRLLQTGFDEVLV